MKSIVLFLAGCGLALALSAPAPAQDIAVRAGKVITMQGRTLTDGMVLIRDGRIADVGPAAKVEVPAAVQVLEFREGVVMPGLVHPNTWRGMGRYRNESNPVLPFLSTADGIDPEDDDFLDSMRLGYTTLHIIPYHDCVLGGTGLVVRPNAPSVAAMTVAAPRIQKISLSKQGMGRIMAIHALETAFQRMAWELEAKRIKEKEDREEAEAKGEKYEKPDEKPLPPEKRDLAALVRGEGKAFFYCDGADDLAYAIRFARRHGFQMVPVVSNKCWRHLELLKRAELPAILAGPVEFIWTDPETEKKRTVCPAAMLEELGVPFALTTTAGSDLLEANPFYRAAVAVRGGVSRERALRALTTVPAELLGLDKRLGSLAKGMDGNLIVLTGDPLDTLTLLEKVIIEGKVAYSRDEDPVMKEVVAHERELARRAAEKKKKAEAEKKKKEQEKEKQEGGKKTAPKKKAASKKKTAGKPAKGGEK